jgi:hypothetical protein
MVSVSCQVLLAAWPPLPINRGTKQVLALSNLTLLQTFALIHLVAHAAFSLLIRVFRAFSLLDSSYNLQLFHNQVSILCPAPPR